MQKIKFLLYPLFIPFILNAQADGSPVTSYGANGQCKIQLNGTDLQVFDAEETEDGSVFLSRSLKREGENHDDMMILKITSEGIPDPDFGIKFYDIAKKENVARAMAIQQDGSIILSGWYHNGNTFDILVLKLKPTGEVDITFAGNTGFKIFDFGSTDFGQGVALDENDNIFVCGRSFKPGFGNDIIVVKMDKNGQLLNNFGTGGVARLDFGDSETPYDIKLGADNNIYLATDVQRAGLTRMGVVKCLPDGTPDPGFGAGGLSSFLVGIGDASTVSIDVNQNTGDIILAGNDREPGDNRSSNALVKILPDGNPDLLFSPDGNILFRAFDGNSYATDALFAADGSIITLETGNGNFGSDVSLHKFNTNGQPVFNFGNNGTVIADFNINTENTARLILLRDGNLLATGYSPTQNSIFAGKFYNVLTSSTEQNEFSKPVLYPNPGTGHSLNIKSEEMVRGFRIYDLAGRLVIEKTGHYFQNQNNLPTGMYIVEIQFANYTTSTKWFVQ